MNSPKGKIELLNPDDLSGFHFWDDGKMKVGQSHLCFHINRIEDVIDNLKFPVRPHRKTIYDFIFLTEGHSKRSKGLYDCEFSENTFFFLPAFQITSCEYITNSSKGYFCHFDTRIFDKLFPNNTFWEDINFLSPMGNPLVKVSGRAQDYILTILERLEALYTTTPQVDLALVSLYLATLFKELETLHTNQIYVAHNAAFLLTRKFKGLLSQHIYQTRKVADYADMLFVSPEYLNRSVKAVTGKTAQNVCADMLVLEAKVMLSETDLSVTEIAHRFSELNASDFIRLFKKKVGITPKKYRK